MKFMDKHTVDSLEMEYISNMISPGTPYGKQLKNEIKPFFRGEEALLEREFDEIQKIIELKQSNVKGFKEITSILQDVKEIRNSLRRSCEDFILDEIELFEIKNFILQVKELCEIIEGIDSFSENLKPYRLLNLEELLDPEHQGLKTFYIYDGYSDELKRLRQERKSIQRQFEVERKRITHIVEDILETSIKLSGEVSILRKDEEKLLKALECPFLSTETSTILMTTFKLKSNELMNKLKLQIDDLKEKEDREEFLIKKYLSHEISLAEADVSSVIGIIGKLDFFIARAEFALSVGGTRPVLLCNEEINIKSGRHIKLEEILGRKGKKFKPVSLNAHKGVTVITGANMGGKTVNLKISGLLTAMAQFGLFVPAEEFKTCLFDYIYFSIGDMQSIESGLSTFGSEILGMKEILRYSEQRGLILIDELARGTNPEEGYAISRAIVKHLKHMNAVTLFTTHFDGITREDGIEHFRVRGLKGVDFEGLKNQLKNDDGGVDTVLNLMDYSLEHVVGDFEVPKDAINIAKLMGLDDIILDLAEEILKSGKEDYNE